MIYPPAQAAIFLAEVRKILAGDNPDDRKLHDLWRTLCVLHSCVLARNVYDRLEGKVASGPFKGMRLARDIDGGMKAPVLLGAYEHELHATVEQIVARPYRHILNIGCAFGYYAVGLALRMPNVAVHAFDIDEGMRTKCAVTASLNNVGGRVQISGEFHIEDFANYPPEETLAIVDIEGAETVLLDPERAPALKKMDMIVELHDCNNPAISRLIAERFAPTHAVEIVHNRNLLYPVEKLIGADGYIDPFDHIMLTWELRVGPTPWAVLRAKSA